MNASINQIKTKQVKVLALPDEVFGLIKQWVLPVKPNLCYNCNINCTENDIHLIKDAPIVPGSALQVLDGGAKFVVESGDVLKVVSDTAASLDAWVSVVDDIST